MELRNFQIKDGYQVVISGFKLDVHNDYDFVDLEFNGTSRLVTMAWKKTNGGWVQKNTPEGFRLIFESTELIYVTEPKTRISEGETLSFVGFLHPEDFATMDGYLEHQDADRSWHMIFGFENGSSIKLFARSVRCDLSV